MPDLHSLEETDEHGGGGGVTADHVLGETDAHDYYARKKQGAMGRANGSKIRPDEAKRLQISMAKKERQRERQRQQQREQR